MAHEVPPKAKFITFEGGEGAGKTTQVNRLADRLRSHGLDVIVTREPGGSPSAEKIRALFLDGDPDAWTVETETLLAFAARAEHIRQRIRPALAAGKWVICDRFVDSTTAYQGHAGGVDPAWIATLSRRIVGDLTPDVTVFVRVPVDVALARAAARDAGTPARFEKLGFAFHQAVLDGFDHIAAQSPARICTVDGTADVKAVAEAVWQSVRAPLGLTPAGSGGDA